MSKKNTLKIVPALGLIVLVVLLALVISANDHPVSAQEAVTETQSAPQKPCADCHPDKQSAWLASPHAHASDDSVFLEGWEEMERAGECLLCHPAEYNADTVTYTAHGVTCESCHGAISANHPPETAPAPSDEEACGTCHPTTLGESRLSGHSSAEVRCMNCHDPHSQKVLFEDPNFLCKDCHKEDLNKMDERLGKIHLQGQITCVACHTLDVQHTFTANYQHEDVVPFFLGIDHSAEIAASMAEREASSHGALGSYVADQMSWPLVHRVSHNNETTLCSDCHIMSDQIRADFIALGYSADEIDRLDWDREDYPALTNADLNKLVPEAKRGSSWLIWLAGVVIVFGVFEFTVTRKLEGGDGITKSIRGLFAKKSSKGKE
jgi:predicted CXXCH cytochrome family protein